MNKQIYSFLILLMVLTSCVHPDSVDTVYNVNRVTSEDAAREGTIVFVRPSEYSVFGTQSLRDYVEIAYERVSRNDVGLLQLDIGIRNRGGQRAYDTWGPDFQVSVKTVFYDKPFVSGTSAAIPIHETNWQNMKLLRGVTEHYQAVCPIKTAAYYQVTISELIKR